VSAAPRTWLLLAEKQGDNAQVEALAGALPWTCETRRLVMQERWREGKPPVAASLDHLDLAASDRLEPPWPDLVVTMGRRTANAAFWVREQSGGRTRIVLVGKPSGWLGRFDLVVGSAEVQLPPFDNVMSIGLPLLRVDPAEVAKAADAWRAEMADWPRPLVAVLVGGPTGPFAFDRAVRERLVRLVRSVRERGGTPFVTTSRRTPAAVADALEANLPGGGRLFRWAPDAPRNPYRALLGLADGFAVTGDSISMLVEVARLRRPLAIVPLSTGPLGALDQWRRGFTRWLFAPAGADGGGRWRTAAARAAFRAGLLTHTRDFNALHEWMVRSGLAVWTDGTFPQAGWPPPTGDVDDDLHRAARRVAALFEGDG
jgi:hypothetical protein